MIMVEDIVGVGIDEEANAGRMWRKLATAMARRVTPLHPKPARKKVRAKTRIPRKKLISSIAVFVPKNSRTTREEEKFAFEDHCSCFQKLSLRVLGMLAEHDYKYLVQVLDPP